MGKTDPENAQPPQPAIDGAGADATPPGVTMIVRALTGVRLRPRAARPRRNRSSTGRAGIHYDNILLGEGPRLRDRPGPPRPGPHPPLHAFLIGVAERALEADVQARPQAASPSTSRWRDQGVQRASASPTPASLIDQARLLTLNAAWT
jgi:hypothetical protein